MLSYSYRLMFGTGCARARARVSAPYHSAVSAAESILDTLMCITTRFTEPNHSNRLLTQPPALQLTVSTPTQTL